MNKDLKEPLIQNERYDEESQVPPKKKCTVSFKHSEELFNLEHFIYLSSILDREHASLHKELAAQKDGTSESHGAILDEADFMTLAKVAELAQDYKTMQTYVRRAIELRVINKNGRNDNIPINTSVQNEDEASKVRYLFSFILFSNHKSFSIRKSAP